MTALEKLMVWAAAKGFQLIANPQQMPSARVMVAGYSLKMKVPRTICTLLFARGCALLLRHRYVMQKTRGREGCWVADSLTLWLRLFYTAA